MLTDANWVAFASWLKKRLVAWLVVIIYIFLTSLLLWRVSLFLLNFITTSPLNQNNKDKKRNINCCEWTLANREATISPSVLLKKNTSFHLVSTILLVHPANKIRSTMNPRPPNHHHYTPLPPVLFFFPDVNLGGASRLKQSSGQLTPRHSLPRFSPRHEENEAKHSKWVGVGSVFFR